MQSFTTDKDFPCLIKFLHSRLKFVSVKYRWCLTFDAMYIYCAFIELLLHQEDGHTQIECILEKKNIWLICTIFFHFNKAINHCSGNCSFFQMMQFFLVQINCSSILIKMYKLQV